MSGNISVSGDPDLISRWICHRPLMQRTHGWFLEISIGAGKQSPVSENVTPINHRKVLLCLLVNGLYSFTFYLSDPPED